MDIGLIVVWAFFFSLLWKRLAEVWDFVSWSLYKPCDQFGFLFV